MNNYILAGASFLAGAVISGVAAFLVTKKACDRKHQEEINVIWKQLSNTKDYTELKNKPEINEAPLEDKPDIFEYAKKLEKHGYTVPELEKTNDMIHEISENDIDEDVYDRIDLTLYADGILADDTDYPVKSLKDTVGENFHEIFVGKDEIFIRNETRKIDYDVVRSMLTYGEMLDRHPETEQRLQYADAIEEFDDENDDDMESDVEYEEEDD